MKKLSSENKLNFNHSTRYWHSLEDGRTQCDVCPRFCRLKEGQRGLCFVRGNEKGKIVLTTYGRSSGFCIDPIEKKPLHHFLPGVPILSFGTAGCNLACKFCQNWDISKSKEMDILQDQASPELIAQAAYQTRCQAVAFTYNDPTIFLEYAIDVAQACHAVEIKTVSVTAGYICDVPRKDLYQHIDAANVDLKGFTERFYRQVTGGQLQPVLETLTYLKKETNVWLEITNLLIPGENDSEKEIEEMTLWIAENLGFSVPLHFTAFHPDYKMIHKSHTSIETLRKARQIALKNGLHYVYTGNLSYEEGESTFCAQCHKKIIGRNRYKITEWKLNEKGECHFCHAHCPGVFQESPGKWGDQRLPIRLIDFRNKNLDY